MPPRQAYQIWNNDWGYGGQISASSSAAAGDTPKYLRIRIRDVGMGIKDEGRAFGSARSLSQVRWDRLHKQQLYAAVQHIEQIDNEGVRGRFVLIE